MADAYVIRQAVVADAAALRELRLEALQAHPEAFGSDYESEVVQTAADWEKRIADQSVAAIFVAEAGLRLIGMCGLAGNTRAKLRHVSMIWGVYVRPAWRGRGVSAALLASVEVLARARGQLYVKLAVITSNAPAIRAYERAGFQRYGVEPCVIRLGDVCYDELLMAKQVQGAAM